MTADPWRDLKRASKVSKHSMLNPPPCGQVALMIMAAFGEEKVAFGETVQIGEIVDCESGDTVDFEAPSSLGDASSSLGHTSASAGEAPSSVGDASSSEHTSHEEGTAPPESHHGPRKSSRLETDDAIRDETGDVTTGHQAPLEPLGREEGGWLVSGVGCGPTPQTLNPQP